MANFMEAILKRRSIYMIGNGTTLPDDELVEKITTVLKNLPTAFNMQNTSAVVLFSAEHEKLWDIVMAELRKIVPAEQFSKTEEKVNSFKVGHGTVLFFHNDETTRRFKEDYPGYDEKFDTWVLQHGGMLQLAVWVLLEEEGLGASLQHYNPLIDDAVKKTWNLPASWHLMAQMPFGEIKAPAAEKEFDDINTRIKVFK